MNWNKDAFSIEDMKTRGSCIGRIPERLEQMNWTHTEHGKHVISIYAWENSEDIDGSDYTVAIWHIKPKTLA